MTPGWSRFALLNTWRHLVIKLILYRASDYSIALPDLEIDPDAQMEIEREIVGAPVLVRLATSILRRYILISQFCRGRCRIM